MAQDPLQDIPESLDLTWVLRAACQDLEIAQMFVSAGHVIDPLVLDTCRACPVRVDCLVHAYGQKRTSGYFGGMSPGQRREMSLEAALEYVAGDPPQQLAA